MGSYATKFLGARRQEGLYLLWLLLRVDFCHGSN